MYSPYTSTCTSMRVSRMFCTSSSPSACSLSASMSMFCRVLSQTCSKTTVCRVFNGVPPPPPPPPPLPPPLLLVKPARPHGLTRSRHSHQVHAHTCRYHCRAPVTSHQHTCGCDESSGRPAANVLLLLLNKACHFKIK